MKNGYTLVELIIVVIFGVIILSIGGCVFFGIKGCQHVQEHGIKNTAGQLWEGNTNKTTQTEQLLP